MNEIAESLRGSPALFPHSLDVSNDGVSFVRLSRADYDSASFLDARLITSRTIGRSLAWSQVMDSIEAAKLSERCSFIFHIGHVGSTLLSRLIGAHPCAFSLREPLILRAFAQMRFEPADDPRAWSVDTFESRLGGYLKLLSRTFDAKEIAIVKATSFVSELAGDLLARAAAPKALMMTVSPESYLATILGGPNSRQEAKILTPSRLRRLVQRVGDDAWRLESLSEGEALALGWACETSALAGAAGVARGRSLQVDFDRFLADPAPTMLAAFRHFDIDATATDVHAILAGPHMQRYSKAPEYAYDAALRKEVLDHARATHRAEIRRGLNWLDNAAARFPPIREAFAFAAGTPSWNHSPLSK